MTPGDRPRSLFDDPLRFRPDEKTSSLADNAGRFKPSANPPSLFDDPLHLPPAEKAPSIFDDPLRNAEAVLSGPQQPFEELKGPPISPSKAAMQRFFRDKPAMISLIVLLSIFFLSLVFPPIYEHIGQPLHEDVGSGFVVIIPPEQYHSPQYQDDARLTQLPSGTHWLGTDDSGQDILARMLKGMQVSLLVVIGIEIQDVVFGIFFGVLAGYFGGVIDMLLARFTDLMFAFPGLLFALLVVAIFGSYFDNTTILGFQLGPYGRIVLACFILGFIIWPQMARYVRAQTLQLKEQEFVVAARANGASNLRIILRHIVPNMGSLIIVAAMLDLAGNIGAESTLSFLGLGVQPPGSGLGLMIAQYVSYIQAFPYEIIWPMIGVTLLVLTCSFIGNGLESAFDPHEQDYGFLVLTDEEKSKLN